MTLDDFNAAFVYTPDAADTWRILSADSPDGDCDDYAITVAYIEAGGFIALLRGLLTCRFVVWYVWDMNRVSHVALWVRGKGWIDNWFPAYSLEPMHKKRFPALLPVVLFKLLLGKLA